ncbi:MAG TPA: nickel pincer cofactor biosynthesis protein LarB [bacterium (Candidatus Stahlbacteria)]|nr:nickel pincer cofactor biosynthesis protein LarB [Candidatus Stahlbacteria bacterium]
MAGSSKARGYKLKDLVKRLYSRKITPDQFLKLFSIAPSVALGDACIDLHREYRKGFPEVVFCPGKTDQQIIKIARTIYKTHHRVLLTRIDDQTVKKVRKRFSALKHFKKARMVLIGPRLKRSGGLIGVVTAGSSDIPVAEEAAVTCEILGRRVKRFYDVGVAGIHRLTGIIGDIADCQALIVVAGMEGALPSIIAGIVDIPIIGVPTSVGYGAQFNGIAPLLTMLNSCSTGLVVVNIDNGFGAGFFAVMITR